MRDRKPPSAPPNVAGGHRTLHRSNRVTIGGAIVALLVLSRVVAFSVGCGPKDGEQGGKCLDNGCNTYCSNGSNCDNATDTCGQGSDEPTPAPVVECSKLENDACGASSVPYTCQNGATPTGSCEAGATDWAGSVTYCCAPACQTASVGQQACSGPAVTYWCDNPLDPQEDDGPSSCVDLFTAEHSSGYCCAPAGTCFGDSFNLVLPCAGSGDQYFCTGGATASPPGRTCTEVPADGGAGIRAFCCAGPDAGDASEGGLTDAGDAGPTSDAHPSGDAGNADASPP
jgi:hypothetical protein